MSKIEIVETDKIAKEIQGVLAKHNIKIDYIDTLFHDCSELIKCDTEIQYHEVVNATCSDEIKKIANELIEYANKNNMNINKIDLLLQTIKNLIYARAEMKPIERNV